MKTTRYLLGVVLLLFCPFCFAQNVLVNELMAANSASYADETGSFEDWFELYNPEASSVDLGGWYLSDDPTNLRKYLLPSGTGQYIINPGAVLLLWASGIPTRGPKHIGFSLSTDGEELFVVKPDGTTIADHLVFSKQHTDISFGRKTNGATELVFFSPSSPGTANIEANGYSSFSSPPVFNVASGFFQNPFQLTITTTQPGGEIYYTTDGSEPDKNNITAPGKSYHYINQYPMNPGQTPGPMFTNYYLTLKQTSPISIDIIDKSTAPDVLASISATFDYVPTYNAVPEKPVYKGNVIRAKVYEAGKLPSETISRTYLFTPNGLPKSTLPVVSIKMSPDYMFDYTKGIGVAGKDFVDWRNANPTTDQLLYHIGNFYRSDEIPVNFEFLVNGSAVLNQEIGLRIHGSHTRRFDKKSFRLYSTGSNASASNFDYQIFPNLPFHTFKRLILRNSGNDYERLLFKDAFIHQIGKGLNMELQDYRPVTTYLNGEYWGIHNLRERLDEYYYASHYGLDANNIEYFADPDINGNSGEYAVIDNFVKTQNMTVQANYDYAKDRLDMDNLIDYSVLELYCANWDWPYGNVTYWRNKVPFNPSAGPAKDGRWRWSLFDVDLSFEEYWADQFPKALGQNGNATPTFLLKYVLPNLTFRNKFINRYADLVNSHFKPQRLIDQINVCKNAINAEIPENIKRWNRPASVSTWESLVGLMVTFANERPNVVWGHIQSQFGLTDGTQLITVNVSNAAQGYVKVNTIDIVPETLGIDPNPYPWSGKYFKNVAIQLKAIAKPGFKFVRWENVTNGAVLTTETIEFNPSATSSYKAFFTDVVVPKLPAALDAAACSYQFNEWSATSAAGTFPPNMAFVEMANDDPGLTSNISGFTSGVYNFTSRTRINGLGTNGISFINTGNGQTGYTGMRLGGALLALNTTDKTRVHIKWTGGTVTVNSREYAIRLQYRVSDTGPFTDVLDGSGQPVEYRRNTTAGHSQAMAWASLPVQALNQPYVQVLWRYYYTGPATTNARDELRLDDIEVMSCSDPLPVKLISFKAEPKENHVLLSWQTTEETNNDHFEIERSADAKRWSVIASVRGNGNTIRPTTYETTDDSPMPGKNYYRLKQVDLDWTYAYSRMVEATLIPIITANVYPNPVNDYLEFHVAYILKNSSYLIYGSDGRVVKPLTKFVGTAARIKVTDISPGLYVLILRTDGLEDIAIKFIKD